MNPKGKLGLGWRPFLGVNRRQKLSDIVALLPDLNA
jgi:hypothetical protein